MVGNSNQKIGAPAVHRPVVPPNTGAAAREILHRTQPQLWEANQIAQSAAHWFEPYQKLAAAAHDTTALPGELVGSSLTAARESRDGIRAVKAASVHLMTMAQRGRDVNRIKRNVLIFEKLVEHRGTQRAAALLPRMRMSQEVAEAAWQHERTLWNSYRRIGEQYGKVQANSVGKWALGIEDTIKRSPIGQGLLAKGTILKPAWAATGHALTTAGAAIALVKGVNESPAQSAGGKAASGALAAGASVMMNWNPAVSLADFAVEKTVGEQYSAGKFYEGTAHTIAALGSALFASDSQALSNAHARSMRGDNGAFMQAYARIGDALSKTSIVDNALTSLADWSRGVPEDFRTTTLWWEKASEQPAITDD